MANAPRVTYGQGIARHHGSHLQWCAVVFIVVVVLLIGNGEWVMGRE
ncbi:MAG: hypothetical protein F6K50_42630 [Moorea sp. SIO3I7]|nr:hypothetical protein [Moorena sp. SIO3I7]